MPPTRKPSSQEFAAAALAKGATVVEAATLAGVDERTVYKWRTDAKFKARVAEIRGAIVQRAIGVLGDSMVDAAVKLKELLASADQRIALRAAVALLELGLKGVEVEDIRRQLDELEAAIKERGR